MPRLVKAATETKKLIDQFEALRKNHEVHRTAVENNTKELKKINEARELEIQKAINDKEKEVRRDLEKVRWVRYDQDVYAVKKHNILNKLDIL